MKKDTHWWGYYHNNGTLHVKRFFCKSDIKEATDSPFVKTVITEFPATCRDFAIRHIKDLKLEEV